MMQAFHILPSQIDTVQNRPSSGSAPSGAVGRDGNSFHAAFEAAQRSDVRESNPVQKEAAPRESGEVRPQDARDPGTLEAPDRIQGRQPLGGQSYSAILSDGEISPPAASGDNGLLEGAPVHAFADFSAAAIDTEIAEKLVSQELSLSTDSEVQSSAQSLENAFVKAGLAGAEDSAGIQTEGELTETAVSLSAAGIADENAALSTSALPDENTNALKGKKTASVTDDERKQDMENAEDIPVIGVHSDSSIASVIASQGLPENAGTENSGNLKRADRQNREGPTVIEVRDERSSTLAEGAAGRITSTVNGDGTADMSLSFSLPGQDSTGGISEGGESRNTKTVFSSILADELQNNAGELVKTGSIILRDNNSGSIRLTLHPEELGNVKINMELTDKIISGRIVVSTEEAFQAFRSSLQELRDAFIAGGFENAGFELSLASGSGEQSGGSRESNHRAPFYDASLLAADTAAEEAGYGGWFRSEIDVLV